MTALVVDQLERLLPRGRSPQLIVGEVPAAQGVADVIAAQFDTSAIRDRAVAGIGPITSPLKVRTLMLLVQRGGIDSRELARLLDTSERALRRSTLSPLIELGVVALDEGVVWSTGAWQPVAAHVTSVELKLSKWRDALRQADNFARSVDRSWVVLDAAHARAAISQVGYFEALGVGLAILSPRARLRVVARPRGRRPVPWLRALIGERAWDVGEADVVAIARRELEDG